MNPQKLCQMLGISLCVLLVSAGSVFSEIVQCTDGTGSWRLEEYITTHYTKEDGGHFYSYYGKDADVRYKNREKAGHPWNDLYWPKYDYYFNQKTADTAIKIGAEQGDDVDVDPHNGVADLIDSFEHDVYQQTGYHCDILNYNEYVPISSYLLEDQDNMQILNNVRWYRTLITVYFPPDWNKTKSLPLLVKGNGYKQDNNRIYLRDPVTSLQNTSLAVLTATHGVITLQVNCGGRESVGINSKALEDIGQFIASVMPSYGGDPNKVMMIGSSRGGNTALVWGANPDSWGYDVKSIHAVNPAFKFGSMFRYSGATYPAVMRELCEILGTGTDEIPERPELIPAYKSYYVDEDSGLIMTPEEKGQAATKILLNETAPISANDKSAYGYYTDPNLIPELRAKRIIITQATHDAFMPMSCFVDFDRHLTEEEIPHKSYIGYGYGHVGNFVGLMGDINSMLDKLVDPENPIEPFTMAETERRSYMPTSLSNEGSGTKREDPIRITDDVIDYINSLRPGYFAADHREGDLAFSASLPYRVKQGQPVTIVLAGKEGKYWKIQARVEDGYHPIYVMYGIFGEEHTHPHVIEQGDEYIVLHFDANAPSGWYEWFFWYDHKEIPNRFTPFVSPDGNPAKAVMEIVAEEPELEDYSHPYMMAENDENFGVDMYHPLLQEEPSNPTIVPINDIVVDAGDTIIISINVDPPHQYQLVYDLRAPNDCVFQNIDLNGLTGEIVFNTTQEDIGTYEVCAIAKDGRGGIGNEYFKITVN